MHGHLQRQQAGVPGAETLDRLQCQASQQLEGGKLASSILSASGCNAAVLNGAAMHAGARWICEAADEWQHHEAYEPLLLQHAEHHRKPPADVILSSRTRYAAASHMPCAW
jgi:hypothetical protein